MEEFTLSIFIFNLQESTDILEGKFDLDVDIYDRISTFTTLIGDYTATGVLQYLRATGM